MSFDDQVSSSRIQLGPCALSCCAHGNNGELLGPGLRLLETRSFFCAAASLRAFLRSGCAGVGSMKRIWLYISPVAQLSQERQGFGMCSWGRNMG